MLNTYQFNTPIGVLGVEWENETMKIHRVILPQEDTTNNGSKSVEQSPIAEQLPTWMSSIVNEFQKYFSGYSPKFLLDYLNYDNFTQFQVRVHQHVFAIPCGKTRTYSEVARAVDSPGAARAVGNTMACNPYPLIVPCHRVVAQGGGLGGYRGGLDAKKFLLALEQKIKK